MFDLRNARLSAVLALGLAICSPAAAQVTASSVPGMAVTPTTKVLAIGHLTAKATPEAMKTVMPKEVRDTVRLYLAGTLEQWFSRKDKNGVVFVLNVKDVAEAHRILEALPLGQQGLMEFDLIPLGPLAPLGLLLGPSAP